MKLLKKIILGSALLLVVVTAVVAVLISHTSACPPGTVEAGTGSSAQMQAIRYHCYGGPEVLQLETVERPAVADDEILVKVHAAGVNPLDWHYMRGSPYIMRALAGLGSPNDPGFGVDFAGTVVAVGASVDKFLPGNRVFGGANGAFAEYVVKKQDGGVAKMDDNVSFEQAAAMPIAAVSALQALRDAGQLQAGQSVLINGASGGVGTYAVQIAKAMGATVTGVCSTRNVAMVKSIGADHVVDYKKEDFVDSGVRYDLIIDNVGNWSISELRRAMTDKGRLVMVGGPSGDWLGPFKNSFGAMLHRPFTEQQLLGFLAEITQPDLQYLAGLMASGKVRSVIDRRYQLKEVADAIAYSESGRARGKIIIKP